MSDTPRSNLGAHLDRLAFAFGALGRRGGRTWALVGGLASAMALLSAVVFLTEALRAEAARASSFAPDLVVQRLVGGRPALVDVAAAETMRPVPGVASARARVWGYLFLTALQGNVTVVGGGEPGPRGGAPGLRDGAAEIGAGRALTPGERGGCVLGARLSEALGVRVGDKVVFPLPGGDESEPGVSLKVVGLFASPVALWTSDVAIMSDDDARALLGLPEGAATDVAVYLTNPDESSVVARKALASVPGARVLERRLLERVHMLSYGRRAGFVLGASLPALVALLALAFDRLSGLGPAERREIAVLKASGWSTVDVIVEKLYEALLVGAGAGALGLVLGYLWAFTLGAPGLREVLAGWSVLYPETRLTPAVDAAQLFGLLALVTAPYLALSVGPAWRAATIDPLEAMRAGLNPVARRQGGARAPPRLMRAAGRPFSAARALLSGRAMTSMLSSASPHEEDVIERARVSGVATLGDAELVQLVLCRGRRRPTGVAAARVLEASGGLALLSVRGLDPRTASGLGLDASQRLGLEAALELGRRATVRRALSGARRLGGPGEVAAWARLEFGGAEREELWLVTVDGRGSLCETRRVAQGGSWSSVLSVRDVLSAALRSGCPAFLLVHNHPSGDPTPSASDARATLALADAATVVGLSLLDHVVVGAEGHASLLEMGLLAGRGGGVWARAGGRRGRKGDSPP